MYGWAGRLKEFFCRKDRAFIVLLTEGEPGAYSLCKYTENDAGWQLAEQVEFSATAEMLAEQGGTAVDDLVEAVGRAALEIARKGWQEVPLLYVLPEGELLGYALNLPPDLTAEQQREAAYWEFDDKLLARGLSVENFACICHPARENGGQCTIMGVRRGYLQEVEQAFAQAELALADIIPAAGSGAEAVLSYLNSSQKERGGFKQRSGEGFSARRILAAWFGLLFVLGTLLLAVDIYQYKQAQSMAAEQQQELVRLAQEQRAMQAMEEKTAAIARREKLMLSFNKEEAPWYSLLVHLGTDTTEGVSLTGVYASADGKQLYLEGQAVTYDVLAEFVAHLEEEREFFPQGISLENSTLVKGREGAPDKINFSVSIDWELADAGDNTGEVQDGSL